MILGQASLADFFGSKGIFLESGGEGIFSARRRVGLIQLLGSCQGCAGNGMRKGLGLRLCTRWSSESSLGLGGSMRFGEKGDLIADRSAKVVERFANVGRVVVCLVGVLRGYLEKLLMNLLQGIDSFLKLDVVWW